MSFIKILLLKKKGIFNLEIKKKINIFKMPGLNFRLTSGTQILNLYF